MLKYLMVGAGGFFGSIARFWLGSYIGNRWGTRMPYGTFVINVTGCFLVGFVLSALSQRMNWSPMWTYLLPIGFIGGYTTFSAFAFETVRAAQKGQILVAALNVSLSVVVGLLAVWFGAFMGKST